MLLPQRTPQCQWELLSDVNVKRLDATQRLAVVHVFVQAKTRLWDGTAPFKHLAYICNAIDAVPHKTPEERHAKSVATRILHRRLGGSYVGLQHWLKDRGIRPENVQVYRHAWLDSLIKEYRP
jgi:hypothetical protein